LRYLNHVADRFALRQDITFDTRVQSANYDEKQELWSLTTNTGSRFIARFCIMATGCLSVMNKPDLPNLEGFKGAVYYTGEWPHEGVNFAGKRVGVIGTGSSSIQCIPIIAKEAKSLTVFQRTPGYCVPARNAPLDPNEIRQIKANYSEFRKKNESFAFAFDVGNPKPSAKEATTAERREVFEECWRLGGLRFLGSYEDLIVDRASNDLAAEFLREKIKEIVLDPAVAAKLLPKTTVGCKRLCLDTGYYATYNRENVTLVDLNTSPITHVTPDGLATSDQTYDLDCIVFGTGFDAMTGALNRIDIRGREGLALRDKWAEGPRAYLGLASADFPNMFIISGPGSPSVLTNMVPSIEQHVEFVGRCLAYMKEYGLTSISASRQAEDDWVDHVNSVADGTLYPGCNSWYLGANVPGKPRIFMALVGFPDYVKRCEEIERMGYSGFVLRRTKTTADTAVAG
jgi:cyclohexanone monooxygenase